MSIIKYQYFGLIAITVLFAFGKKNSNERHGNILSGVFDKSQFAADSVNGWDIYDAYLHQDTQDSVAFELILKHVPLGNWGVPHFVGKISDSTFFPKTTQELTYYLLLDRWHIKVNTNGDVLINLEAGSPPPGNPVIIPFKTKFKNSN